MCYISSLAGDQGKVTSVRKTSSQNPSHDATLRQEIHPIKPTILNRDDKESQEMEHSSKNRKNEPSQNEPHQNEPSQNEPHQNAPIIKETDPIKSNILKGEEREKKYLSLWTMETLVLLLAILIIVFMAVTVRMLLLLTKSVTQLQNLPAVKYELFPGSKLMS